MYCTPDDVRALLSGYGPSDTSSSASLPDPAIQAAIDEAHAEIDGKLGGRYSTPFDDRRDGSEVPVPALVKTVAAAIAAYLATLTRRQGDPLVEGHPALLRYTRAQGVLKGLMDGSITLDLPAEPSAEQPAQIQPRAVNTYEGRMFTPRQYGIVPSILDPFAARSIDEPY